MKSIFLFFSMIVLTVSINAQMFTKVIDGDLVNDGGDSRAVNWIDYDNDGDLDLYVTNGPQLGEHNFLYRNNGDGTFTKITSDVIVNDGKASDGSTWGDYDNDGDIDLFVANWWGHNNLLYSNNGDGSFTFESTLAPSIGVTYSETGSWGDCNNDGYLDLYVCNSGGNRRNQLFINNTDGTFTQITTGAIATNTEYSRNADWIDFDGDGFLDLYVTNEENQNNALYKGNSDTTFTKVTGLNIVSDSGNSTSSNWEDIDNDGDFDLFIANWGNQNNFLYTNNGDGSFTKVSGQNVVTDGGNSFGSSFGDVDNDGDLDFIVTNAFVNASQVNFFYLNNGDGTFARDTGIVSAETGWSYGTAFGDYDDDGYLDLFVAKCYQATENNSLFKNNGGTNNWIKINLIGAESNYSAIGAIVKLKAEISGEPVWQMRRVAGQNGYCGQNLQLHFGLGDAVTADSIIIEWPSGIKQVLTNQNTNQTLIVTEDSVTTSVDDKGSIINDFELHQNYPNPFNPETNITFNLETGSEILLSIYNQLGESLGYLFKGYKEAGTHKIKFDGKNLTSGIYFYTLIASSGLKQTRKMILLK
ncbi:MAG: T9SS C-terminal target domain-containing protein [Ignavibacteriales bacterium]|nr:MAG: T9SS C-terminal target domain-containing protein [Ignavibacteriales bacterium]